MNYHSLGQYFYKLYAILFIVMLVPILFFILLYQALRVKMVTTPGHLFPADYTSLVAGIAVCVVWGVAFMVFYNRLKAIRKVVSLGERLSRYANLTIVRSVLFSLGLLMLTVGYFFSENPWLTIAFMTSLFIPAFFWPVPARVCRHLKLKADERMMVYYKMDDL
ncbi:MAG: hypothetical protein KF725_15965 [Cyclobacteriaceae bacterium]|nr:hypothetical protein [Cyclobacteriaceae bacterium]UYN87833.1 MAG: hypothetical protein KIT51_06145 [Cyclobacteriaceae bacterium]